jgi:hypothetical protein
LEVKAKGKWNIMKTSISMLPPPNIVKIIVVKSTECVVGAMGLHGKTRIA